jgi:hypothetical protein
MIIMELVGPPVEYKLEIGNQSADFKGLYISSNPVVLLWLNHHKQLPFVHNSKYAGEAGDDNDASEPSGWQPDEERSKRLKIRTYEPYIFVGAWVTPTKEVHNQPPAW